MENVILQITFDYGCSESELLEMADELVGEVNATEGLVWKIWTHNAEENRAGGVYHFESRRAAEAYVQGPVGDAMRESPVLSNLDVQYFGIMEEPSRATNAPVFETARN